MENESTVEKLLKRAESREQAQIENEETYRKALNDLAASDNGRVVLKTMIKALGIFAVMPSRDGASIVAEKTLRDFYLTVIRKHLDADNRRELEN